MVLAQQTEIVLLDEPTTFLDIAHRYDVLDLCAELHQERSHLAILTNDDAPSLRSPLDLLVASLALIR